MGFKITEFFWEAPLSCYEGYITRTRGTTRSDWLGSDKYEFDKQKLYPAVLNVVPYFTFAMGIRNWNARVSTWKIEALEETNMRRPSRPSMLSNVRFVDIGDI